MRIWVVMYFGGLRRFPFRIQRNVWNLGELSRFWVTAQTNLLLLDSNRKMKVKLNPEKIMKTLNLTQECV